MKQYNPITGPVMDTMKRQTTNFSKAGLFPQNGRPHFATNYISSISSFFHNHLLNVQMAKKYQTSQRQKLLPPVVSF